MKPEASGVVLDVRGTCVSVAFQDESEMSEIKDLDQCAIVKMANDVTYRIVHCSNYYFIIDNDTCNEFETIIS